MTSCMDAHAPPPGYRAAAKHEQSHGPRSRAEWSAWELDL